jgi:hypothetical protein
MAAKSLILLGFSLTFLAFCGKLVPENGELNHGQSTVNCDFCGQQFRPQLIGQRFCCRACSDAFHAQERRQAVEWFRRLGMMVETPATRREAAE